MKAVFNNEIVEVEYYHKKDPFCSVNGEWVDRKKVKPLPIQWTTYALIAIGCYLVGLLTTMAL